MPVLSIITPTFNSEKTLSATLDSIVNQSFTDFEVWIIDGGSNDATLSIIHDYAAKDKRIKYHSEPDKGIYDAMNKGSNLITGEWVYFLGSDDQLYSNKVLEEIFTSSKINEYSVIYGNVIFKLSDRVYDGEFSALKLLKKNICHQSIFIRKKTLDYIGPFDIRYIGTADWLHNIQWFFDRRIKKIYVNKIIAIYNEDGFSFNVKDKNFIKDRKLIINRFFPLHARLVFKYKKSRLFGGFIKKLLKNQ